jgi:hypothetical protein
METHQVGWGCFGIKIFVYHVPSLTSVKLGACQDVLDIAALSNLTLDARDPK